MLFANNIPDRRRVRKLTAAAGSANAITIDTAECGTDFFLSAMNAAAYTVKLPTLANAGAGWHCRFIVNDADQALGQIVTIESQDSGKMVSTFLNNAVYQSEDGGDDLKFAATALKGEQIEVFTDGEFWYLRGHTSIAAGIAF